MPIIPFLDLRVTDSAERQVLLGAIDRVLLHGRLINGPEVDELERAVAARVGRRHAIGVGSGTDALVLAMSALDIGPGDEVITTPLSFMATTNAILSLGAVPVFADILDDLTIDPTRIEALIGPRTRLILPVHWAGKVCRMEEIRDIADRHGVTVVEDCAQAFGALRAGKASGAFGSLGCFSMNTMKPFASLGEAGMIVTDDDSLASRIRVLRYHGFTDRVTCREVSGNHRLDTIQAAVLLERLKRFDDLVARRRDHAAYYLERLKGVVGMFPDHPGCRDVYYTFTIVSERRDQLREALAAQWIETNLQHPLLCSQQPALAGRGSGECLRAERMVQQVLCLPANEKITDDQRAAVADAVIAFFDGAR
jgi:dTDP-4-amino-4,6-dideoxygalactose transaminase